METKELTANLLNVIEQEWCRAQIESVDHLQDFNTGIHTLH
jgi:hypothetical protein